MRRARQSVSGLTKGVHEDHRRNGKSFIKRLNKTQDIFETTQLRPLLVGGWEYSLDLWITMMNLAANTSLSNRHLADSIDIVLQRSGLAQLDR